MLEVSPPEPMIQEEKKFVFTNIKDISDVLAKDLVWALDNLDLALDFILLSEWPWASNLTPLGC